MWTFSNDQKIQIFLCIQSVICWYSQITDQNLCERMLDIFRPWNFEKLGTYMVSGAAKILARGTLPSKRMWRGPVRGPGRAAPWWWRSLKFQKSASHYNVNRFHKMIRYIATQNIVEISNYNWNFSILYKSIKKFLKFLQVKIRIVNNLSKSPKKTYNKHETTRPRPEMISNFREKLKEGSKLAECKLAECGFAAVLNRRVLTRRMLNSPGAN